ncbi:MAG: hypothetical protein M3Y41_04615 [Pseudomonadota bacterium]|nr:hypothetical protein [Pseudomonadota bacterium]
MCARNISLLAAVAVLTLGPLGDGAAFAQMAAKHNSKTTYAEPSKDAFDVPASRPASMPKSRAHATRRSRIAPPLPSPPIDENASADQFLRDAQTALQKHDVGAAEEALERAETRVLESTTGDQSRRLDAIEHAREALGHRRYLRPDMTDANDMVGQALSQSASGSAAPVSGG